MNAGQQPPAIANAAVVSQTRKSNHNINSKYNQGKYHAYRRRPGNEHRDQANRGLEQNRELTTETVLELLESRRGNRDDLSMAEITKVLASAGSVRPRYINAQAQQQEIRTVANTVVPLYGTLEVQTKRDDAVRIMSVNINGLGLSKTLNPTTGRLKHVLKNYGVDVLGLQETNTNFTKFNSSHTLEAELRHGADDIRTVVAHNTRELKNIQEYQPGGTAVVLREQLTGFVFDRGKDEKDLGMYCWQQVKGPAGVSTVFIAAYAPCYNTGHSSYYQHLLRYCQETGRPLDPKDLFRRSLVDFIVLQRAQNRRVVLMTDCNENVLTGSLAARLREQDIGMREAVHRAVPGRQGPNTFFKGSEPIDGIWISDDIELISASYLPFDSNLGDHRPVIVDVCSRSITGSTAKRIVPPKARRLNSKVPRIRNKYIELVREGFKAQHIEERLIEIEEQVTFPATGEVAQRLEALDILVTDILLDAEKRCRKIYAAHYEFSPSVKLCIEKCHLFKWVLRAKIKHGKRINYGNMRRKAKRLNEEECLRYDIPTLVERWKKEKEELGNLRQQAPYLRKQFLHNKLQDAKDRDREDEAIRIKNILKAEAHRKTWQSIQRATKPSRVTNVTRVEVPQPDGSKIEYTTKVDVEEAISTELSSRFGRAESAPICQGTLFDLLGATGDTPTAIQILEGTFTPPVDTDPATVLLLDEIARIWSKMGEDEVSIVISQEDFQLYWRKAKEKTSSSLSGLHFGHYKSIAHDDYLSSILARKISVTSASGVTPKRWSRGLSVMLEKIAGVAMVNKLRGILLLEADFNFHNKLIFGQRMLELARKHNLVADEIYNERGCTAEDAILQQVLVYDVARITKRPLVVSQVDAAQCYDRVALTAAALTLRAFKVPHCSVNVMIQALHSMEFFLRTGFGQSESFFGGHDEGKHGLAQGNGAAPPTWQQISTILLNIQKQQGHGLTIECPVSRKFTHQVGSAYVDDLNLTDGMSEEDDLTSALAKSEAARFTWGNGLTSTGGALQPHKCNVTIHAMDRDGKGGWKYFDQDRKSGIDSLNSSDEVDELPSFYIPQGAEEPAEIERLTSDQAVENLGLFTRPDGKGQPHFAKMYEKITNWNAQVKSGNITTRAVWMSYLHQLWPALRYGLGTTAAELKELEAALGSADYYILSCLGVVRSITREWRYFPSTFGGIGLLTIPIETTAAALSMLLQHYKVDSILGTTLQAALEYLQLEIGVHDCPLLYDYKIWGHLATNSWAKALWEKIDHFGIGLKIEYEEIQPPRRNDITIMQLMVDNGIRGNELSKINRVRIAQEALFLSDISTANGKYIDQIYVEHYWKDTEEYILGRHRSTLSFPPADPTISDWTTWKSTLRSMFPSLRLSNRLLRGWQATSTRKWMYRWHDESCTLEEHQQNTIVLYRNDPSDYAYILTRCGEATSPLPDTVPVDITRRDENTVRVLHFGTSFHVPNTAPLHETFLQHLRSFGGTWMWESIQFSACPSWVLDALIRGSLYCVTDGSHIKELAPDICSAAWILYCPITRNAIWGEFAEESTQADSYRGEQLGMLAIHLVLLAIEQYFGESPSVARAFCDNKGTIITFSRKYKRVSPSSTNADVLRVLRRIQSLSKLRYNLRHVKGHQDDLRPQSSLSLEAQLNIDCDKRAKQFLAYAAANRTQRRSTLYTLPLEAVVVFFDGEKQTSDLHKPLRYQVGRAEAKRFYNDEQIMDNDTFESVEWEDLKVTLANYPQMFHIWYAKQCSGFCATGDRLSKWDTEESGKCPNCGCDESAVHLLRCTSKVRKELLHRRMEAFAQWLQANDTHPLLTALLPTFLFKQGYRRMTELTLPRGFVMTEEMRQVCLSMDKIGWRHFTEGKIATELKNFQRRYLQDRQSRLSISSWMKGLIENLLSTLHEQWICRNLCKHHRTQGAKALAARDEIHQEIERQLELGADDLPAHSRCLLEICPDHLYAKPTDRQQYWLNAVEAARAEWTIQNSSNAVKSSLPIAPVFQRARAQAQGRRSSASSQPPPPPPAPTTERLHLLQRCQPTEISQSNITSILHREVSSRYDLTFRRSGEVVQHSSLHTLNPGIWLTDEVINCYLSKVLKPVVNQARVAFFNSFFFSRLLLTGDYGTDPPRYTYSEVRTWANKYRRSGGLLAIPEIYIPINRRCQHWLFLRISTTTKTISIWNSFGQKQYHREYLDYTLRYLGDVYAERTEQGESVDTWKSRWTFQDLSNTSPRQSNSHDCGLFVITSITLLSQRIPLTSTSYTQLDFTLKDTRQRVAHLLWKNSHNKPTVPAPRRQRTATSRQHQVKTTVHKKVSCTKSSLSSKMVAQARKERRKKYKNQRIVLGCTRPQGRILSTDPSMTEQLSRLLNKKRTAASVAEGAATLAQVTQRHAPPKKRKRTNILRLG